MLVLKMAELPDEVVTRAPFATKKFQNPVGGRRLRADAPHVILSISCHLKEGTAQLFSILNKVFPQVIVRKFYLYLLETKQEDIDKLLFLVRFRCAHVHNLRTQVSRFQLEVFLKLT